MMDLAALRLGLDRMPEVGVFSHPVAVAADVNHMTVLHQPVDERGGRDLVAQDIAPFLEAFVRYARVVYASALGLVAFVIAILLNQPAPGIGRAEYPQCLRF
jgi:hypothetical protein